MMRFHVCTVYCFLMIMLIHTETVTSARILCIPHNINSHVIDHSHMALALAQGGHEVTIIIASNMRIPNFIQNVPGLEVIRYASKNPVPFVNTPESSKLFIQASFASSIFERMTTMMELGKKMIEAWHEECQSLLESAIIKEHLKENKYDLAIGDNAALDTFMILPVAYDIPYIIYGIMSYEWIYKVPSLPSFSPHLFSTFGDDMSFWQRFQNTLLYGMSNLMIVDNATLYDIYAPAKNVKSVLEVYEKSSMYFVLDDPVLSYPRPSMPNVLYVGDIVPQPSKPLPTELHNFVEEAKDGVIIISFGSYFDYLPKDIAAKFCRALMRLPQRIVWKLKTPELCEPKPDKLMLMDWLPQNDILGHPNVKLFISHCGINSILESIYHGVPILGVPITIDQPYNAHRVQNRGLGLTMDITNFSEDELVTKASEILHSTWIHQNVQKSSSIMSNKPTKPVDRVQHWVNHVLKYGDRHLRSGAFNLSTAQFYLIDVLLVLFLIIIVLVILSLSLLYCCFRLARRCFRGQVKSKTKVE